MIKKNIWSFNQQGSGDDVLDGLEIQRKQVFFFQEVVGVLNCMSSDIFYCFLILFFCRISFFVFRVFSEGKDFVVRVAMEQFPVYFCILMCDFRYYFVCFLGYRILGLFLTEIEVLHVEFFPEFMNFFVHHHCFPIYLCLGFLSI